MATGSSILQAGFREVFMFFKNLNVRDNTIDPERVAWLKVWFTSKEAGDKVQVLKITTAGKRIGGQPEFYPFVDKYGQYKHVDWPGKVYNDEDLQANTNKKQVLSFSPINLCNGMNMEVDLRSQT